VKSNFARHCAFLLAAAPAAALAQGASGASGLTVYGNLDEYIGVIHSDSGARTIGLNDGAILRSRLGFRGSENLGNGYGLSYNLEMGFNADNGTGADPGRVFDRQSWAGLVTPIGEFRFGRQNTEIFAIGGAIDYTERTTFGSIINTFGVPSRYNNDVSFKSARWHGLMLTLHAALAENTGTSGTTARNTPLYQAALDYQAGPWRAGYVGLLARPDRSTATVFEDVKYHNVYLNYHYGRGTLYAAAVRSNNATNSANGLTSGAILSNTGDPANFFAGTDPNARRYFNIWQLSADYRILPRLKVGALYGQIRDTSGNDAGARGGNVGAFYELSKHHAVRFRQPPAEPAQGRLPLPRLGRPLGQPGRRRRQWQEADRLAGGDPAQVLRGGLE
jgi:predicted porin